MKYIFKSKSKAEIRPSDKTVHVRKTTTFSNKSLTALGPKIRNQLPTDKTAKSFLRFKEHIKTWFGNECNVCRTIL